MKTPKILFIRGDVLLLSGERLTRVEEIEKDTAALQHIDREGLSYELELHTLSVEKNLGQSNEVLASFYSARSVHARLNR